MGVNGGPLNIKWRHRAVRSTVAIKVIVLISLNMFVFLLASLPLRSAVPHYAEDSDFLIESHERECDDGGLYDERINKERPSVQPSKRRWRLVCGVLCVGICCGFIAAQFWHHRPAKCDRGVQTAVDETPSSIASRIAACCRSITGEGASDASLGSQPSLSLRREYCDVRHGERPQEVRHSPPVAVPESRAVDVESAPEQHSWMRRVAGYVLPAVGGIVLGVAVARGEGVVRQQGAKQVRRITRVIRSR